LYGLILNTSFPVVFTLPLCPLLIFGVMKYLVWWKQWVGLGAGIGWLVSWLVDVQGVLVGGLEAACVVTVGNICGELYEG
jgi:hypothetical protein